jgi:D-serine deaminase-like pyridoxal phosphate-dependent protein
MIQELISPASHGFGGPEHRDPLAPDALCGSSLHDGGILSTPFPCLDQEAVAHNIAVMARYCGAAGVDLYPHGKTTMAPQLWDWQLAGGCRGLTAATMQQVRVMRQFGIADILMANELINDGGVAWLVGELRDDTEFTFTCYVDSAEGVDYLDRAMARYGADQRLRVLVELGHANGRTGCRTGEEAQAVAARVAQSSNLRLVGVSAYEGSIVEDSLESTLRAVEEFCSFTRDVAVKLTADDLFEDVPIVSAGGSAFFDVVTHVLSDQSWNIILRSGCYLIHDHGKYERVSPLARIRGNEHFRPGLSVWSTVLSRPESERLILDLGRRDVANDAGQPVVIAAVNSKGASVAVNNVETTRLFDQHAVLSCPGTSELKVGDRVRLGISHPCTTMDKWKWIPVSSNSNRIGDVIRTFFD